MSELELGPNGGLIYCTEYLLNNSDWLLEKLAEIKSTYIIFDCPGQVCYDHSFNFSMLIKMLMVQVELFTHYKFMETLLKQIAAQDIRLCSVHLIDSFYCRFVCVSMT